MLLNPSSRVFLGTILPPFLYFFIQYKLLVCIVSTFFFRFYIEIEAFIGVNGFRKQEFKESVLALTNFNQIH